MSRLVVIRVDASLAAGSGHVMRCLTLAAALRKAGREVMFVCRSHPGHLHELIRDQGFSVQALPAPDEGQIAKLEGSRGDYCRWLGVPQEQDAVETLAAFGGQRPEWLIVDHYGIDSDWENRLKPYVAKLMVIDDLADRTHSCHLLLDQNFFLDGTSRYDSLVPTSCTKLLGPGYALLRPEFVQAREQLQTRSGVVQRVMVFFGGSDPGNVTGRALEALSAPQFGHLAVDVVLGANNVHLPQIQRQIALLPDARLHVQVDNMAQLMAQANLAMGAGGSATWERCCLGLPAIVVTIAENQRPFTEDLFRSGMLRLLGDAADVGVDGLRQALGEAIQDIETNRAQSAKGMQLVSGKGAAIVAGLLTMGVVPARWTMRPAESRDCELYWYWANDPEVRANAFNSKPIPWEDHCRWFGRALVDPKKTLLLADSDIGPIGQVRFEQEGAKYSIGYSIAAQFRGCGQGVPLLARAIAVLASGIGGMAQLEGVVKASNPASAQVFKRLGFAELSSDGAMQRTFQYNIGPALPLSVMQCLNVGSEN